MVGGGEKCM
jgi:hypothetical protein